MISLFSQKSIIPFSKSRAFGLDFNNSAMRIMQFDNKGKNLYVAGWSEKNIPKGVFGDCEILQPEKFKETFDVAMESAKGKITGKKAVISIPENKVFTRVISIPEIDPHQAEEAIKWETESNIPISIEEVYYDWQIIRMVDKKMDVLVVATPKKVVGNYLSVMDKLGIEVVACEAESIATGRSVIEKTNLDFILVVDVGLDSTSFAIYQGVMPIFTASSSVSGRMLTDAIGKNFGWTFEKAESYKIKNGLLGANEEEREKILKVFEPVLSILHQEIEKTINFFSSSLENGKDAQINKIILTGGASNLKGLDNYLLSKLKKEVTLSNPWINLEEFSDEEMFSWEKSQNLATVIGLSLRAQNYEDYN